MIFCPSVSVSIIPLLILSYVRAHSVKRPEAECLCDRKRHLCMIPQLTTPDGARPPESHSAITLRPCGQMAALRSMRTEPNREPDGDKHCRAPHRICRRGERIYRPRRYIFPPPRPQAGYSCLPPLSMPCRRRRRNGRCSRQRPRDSCMWLRTPYFQTRGRGAARVC